MWAAANTHTYIILDSNCAVLVLIICIFSFVFLLSFVFPPSVFRWPIRQPRTHPASVHQNPTPPTYQSSPSTDVRLRSVRQLVRATPQPQPARPIRVWCRSKVRVSYMPQKVQTQTQPVVAHEDPPQVKRSVKKNHLLCSYFPPFII